MNFIQEKARMKRILKACDASPEIVADFEAICRYRTKETAEELLYNICIRHGFTKPYGRDGLNISVRPYNLGQRHPDFHGDDSGDNLVAEQSYRRGYHQGACDVLRMLREDASVAQIEDRIRKLHQWRIQPIQSMSSPGFTISQELPEHWRTI